MTLAAIDLTSEAAEWEVTADRVIYWIFVLDYVVRFSISRSKWLFVKDHVWDLLAIIPFDVLFRLFRFASLGEILRLARYLDLFSYAMRFTTRIRRFFNTNGFKYICIAALVIILLGAVGIHLAEGMSLPNGIWWSFVTATTVGYGDTYPVTTPGKFLAVFLMLTGIGFVGTLTSTITSFFLHPHAGEPMPYREEEIEAIKKKLDGLSSMTDEDIDTMAALLKPCGTPRTHLPIQSRKHLPPAPALYRKSRNDPNAGCVSAPAVLPSFCTKTDKNPSGIARAKADNPSVPGQRAAPFLFPTSPPFSIMPVTSPPRAWAEIDLGAIRHNLNVVKQAAKGEYYMPVVKAAAYGHGLEQVCRTLDSEGIAFFGVANVGEARRISQAGCRTRPYILGPAFPEEREEIVLNGWRSFISTIEEAVHYNSLARLYGKTLPIHISVDTGMAAADSCRTSLKNCSPAWGTGQPVHGRAGRAPALRGRGPGNHPPANCPL